VDAEFFRHFGIYIQRGFLSPDQCRRFIADAQAAASEPATVRENQVNVVDHDYRRTTIASVSPESVAIVSDMLLALRPNLEQHFKVRTTACRTPEFLIYRPGDFFRPHADNIPAHAESDAVVTSRRISTIVFLNSESPRPHPGSFTGGALGFYGLIDDPRASEREFALTGEAGLLVAFRPEIVHRVAPVTDGERFTIVTWFEG
jgi:SM-20-related protein